MEYLHTCDSHCMGRGGERGGANMPTSRQHEGIIYVSLDKRSSNIGSNPLVFVIHDNYHSVLTFLGKKVVLWSFWWHFLLT